MDWKKINIQGGKIKMNEEKSRFVKFEVFHGVHYGIPGCPITESYIHELKVDEDKDFDSEIFRYLIDTGLFPTESGYLRAKIHEIRDGEKIIKDNKILKLSTLELIISRKFRKELE